MSSLTIPEKNIAPYLPLAPDGAIMPYLWLGTWSLAGEMYGRSDHRESLLLLREAYSQGIRHFDTAGFYGHGRSEELLCKLMKKKQRETLFIATKGGLDWQGREVIHNGSPTALRSALCQSLKRLGSEYVDLYQLHWRDPNVPLAESLMALRELKKEGLIRFYGMGNLTSQEIVEFCAKGARIPHQVHYNPLHRTDDILASGGATARSLNCITSPLEQGLLGDSIGTSNAYKLGKKDIRRRNPHFHSAADSAWLSRYHRLCEELGVAKSAMTLAWILMRPHVDVVIAGPRLRSQLFQLLTFKSISSEDFAKAHDLISTYQKGGLSPSDTDYCKDT